MVKIGNMQINLNRLNKVEHMETLEKINIGHLDKDLQMQKASPISSNPCLEEAVEEVELQKIRITVPAGVADGQTIKLKGQGGPGINGGPAGDLYITFVIPEDAAFKRLGDNLYVTVPLDLYTAILGGDKEVYTLDGKVKIKVNPETQNGTKIRLKGKGFPVYKKEGQFGDLIITWSITIPTGLTQEQKELFKKIQSLK